MKKFLLIIFIIAFASPVLAICNYTSLCSTMKHTSSETRGQKISMKLGATALSEKIAQFRIKEELKRQQNKILMYL